MVGDGGGDSTGGLGGGRWMSLSPVQQQQGNGLWPFAGDLTPTARGQGARWCVGWAECVSV